MSKKFYQNDSIRFELAPLRAERRNHRSSTAGLQGAVRPSSCWAHSGTGGAAGPGAEMRRGMSTRLENPAPPLPQTDHIPPQDTQRGTLSHIPSSSHSLCVGLKPTPKMYEHRLPRGSSDTPDTRRSQRLGLAVASTGNVLSLPTAFLLNYYFFSKACLELQPSPLPNAPHSFFFRLLLQRSSLSTVRYNFLSLRSPLPDQMVNSTRTETVVFCSLLYSQYLEQCPAQSGRSLTLLNEWMNSTLIFIYLA